MTATDESLANATFREIGLFRDRLASAADGLKWHVTVKMPAGDDRELLMTALRALDLVQSIANVVRVRQVDRPDFTP